MKNKTNEKVEEWVKYCKLKGLNGGVVMSEDAVIQALTSSYEQGRQDEKERIRAIATGVKQAFEVSLHNAVQDQRVPYRHAIQAIDEEILHSLKNNQL